MFLSSFRPFNKEIEKIFDNIAKYDRAYTTDIKITRNLPRKYPVLFDEDNGFFEIFRNESIRKSVICPRNGIKCMPILEPDSKRIEHKSNIFKKYGIFRIF